MDARSLMDALSEPFPPHAIEQREGAHGKQLDYVATETVIRRLNRVCPEWSFRKTSHEWTDPVEWQDKYGKPRVSRTLIVFGEMTIPPLGTRSGTGVQVVEDGRSGEDLIKGALSDCLKNCAKQFNVGIDLYGPDLEMGEIRDTGHQSAPKLPPRARTTSVGTIPRAEVVSWTEMWNLLRARKVDAETYEAIVGKPASSFPAPQAALDALKATEDAIAAEQATQGELVAAGDPGAKYR